MVNTIWKRNQPLDVWFLETTREKGNPQTKRDTEANVGGPRYHGRPSTSACVGLNYQTTKLRSMILAPYFVNLSLVCRQAHENTNNQQPRTNMLLSNKHISQTSSIFSPATGLKPRDATAVDGSRPFRRSRKTPHRTLERFPGFQKDWPEVSEKWMPRANLFGGFNGKPGSLVVAIEKIALFEVSREEETLLSCPEDPER